MNPAEATREIYWNISYGWLIYVLLAPTVGIGAWGFWRKYRLWRVGQPAVRFDRPGQRLRLLMEHAVAQRRTAQEVYAGAFHRLIVYGFVVLGIATTVVFVQHDFGLEIMKGRFYLYFQSFIVDVFGALVMVGIAMAGVRRWGRRPEQLVYTTEANVALAAIFVIALSGFLVEGWRIAATDDPWGPWSPVGYLVAQVSSSFMSVEAMQTAHVGTWWFHLVLVLGCLSWLPYTKMAHVLTAPLNIYFSNLDGYGSSLKTIDFETAESFGVNSLADFTWKDLLDLEACTECGRCTAVCPAHVVGKALSPRDLILDLRNLMRSSSDRLLAGASGKAEGGDAGDFKVPIIDAATAVSPEALWQCTTCAACMEACPVFIEQMPKIVDARRHLVMEEADFPETLQAAITSLEQRGHPFPGTTFNRVQWADGLDVPELADMANPEDAEVLLWVGCGGALVERNQSIVRSLAQLLRRAGIRYAILGREESCTGDPARRIGNEFLFEKLAKTNIENLERYGVKKIVTSCPHCFNTFANEYPAFGGRYEVYHHSEFLQRLVEEGKLDPRVQEGRRVTFHDPCYLGRHNGIFDAPRSLVQLSTGKAPVEMEQSREKSFCCGGGGGMCYVEEAPDQRVNQERAAQILATDADVVAVGCPFCTTMLEDGLNALRGDREVVVRDVAELLWESVQVDGEEKATAGTQSEYRTAD